MRRILRLTSPSQRQGSLTTFIGGYVPAVVIFEGAFCLSFNPHAKVFSTISGPIRGAWQAKFSQINVVTVPADFLLANSGRSLSTLTESSLSLFIATTLLG